MPEDPPTDTPVHPHSSGSRTLMMLAGLAILLTVLKLAASFLVPVVIALFMAVLSYPLVRWQLARRVPHFVAIILTVLVIVALLGGTATLTADLVVRFIRELPDDLRSMQASIVSFAHWLETKGGVAHAEETVTKAFEENIPWGEIIGYARQADVRNVLTSVLGTTVGAGFAYLSEITLVMILMFFILSEAHGTTSRAQAVQQAGGPDLTKLLSSATEIQKYLGVKTILSGLVGLLAGVWCWVIGLQYPSLWGVLAFALHFIPAVGALIAGILPCLLALVKLGLGDATAIALGYTAINFIVGSFVEPTLMGRRFGVSSLVIVLSVWFWSWMWGAVGAFLAVPLTIMIKVALDNTDEFRWVGVAMSKKKVKKGEIILETSHLDDSEILGAGAATEPPH